MTRQHLKAQSFDHLVHDYELMCAFEADLDYFLENLPSNRHHALDVGCGTGVLAQALSHHFECVCGIDISEPMLDLARRKRSAPNIEYVNMPAESMCETNAYDLIVSRTTLHHCADVVGVLRRLASCVRDGGRMIIVDNYSRWPIIRRHPSLLKVATAVRSLLSVPIDLGRHGSTTAFQLCRARLSPGWREHILSDSFLAEHEFKSVYSEALPAARFTTLPCFIGVIWDKC